MKNIKNKKTVILAIRNFTLATLALLNIQSCQKNVYEFDESLVVSSLFMQSATEGAIQKTMDINDEWIPLKIGAGYGGVKSLGKDIKVEFEVSTKALEEYNLVNGTSYSLPPKESYRFTESSVLIPNGKFGSNATSIEINPLHLAGTQRYLLPIKILSNDAGMAISEELNTTYFLINGQYTRNPFEVYPQKGWAIQGFSSDDYDAGGGRANFAIDGDVNTFWHSQYRFIDGVRPSHPHFIAIDMGQAQVLHGLEIYGRNTQISGTGNPKNIVVETSMDAKIWEEAGSFFLANEKAMNSVYFPVSRNAKFFKITVVASHADVYRTHIGEIKAF